MHPYSQGRIFSFKLGTRLVIGMAHVSFLLTEPHDNQVLNDVKAATDLLDKRGDIYSSRPRFVVAYGS
jgi:hypothetical protein